MLNPSVRYLCGALACALLFTTGSAFAQGGTNETSYEFLENGAGKFKLDIQGCPVASADIESITIEDLSIDERNSITMEDLIIDEREQTTGGERCENCCREMTTGCDWDYRVYGPGDAHYGSITVRARVGKDSKELFQWWQDCSQGKNIRKNISVIACKRDGSEARRAPGGHSTGGGGRSGGGEVFESPGAGADSGEACEPVMSFDGGLLEFLGEPEEQADGSVEERFAMSFAGWDTEEEHRLADKPNNEGVDLALPLPYVPGGPAASTYTPDDMLVVLGFTVTIDNAGSGSDPDSMWESCSGGSLNIEIADASVGSDQFHTTTPGHKYVDTITLKGPLTSGRIASVTGSGGEEGRKAIAHWLKNSAAGQGDLRSTVVLKEILKDGSEGKNWMAPGGRNCTLVGYSSPSFKDDGSVERHESFTIRCAPVQCVVEQEP